MNRLLGRAARTHAEDAPGVTPLWVTVHPGETCTRRQALLQYTRRTLLEASDMHVVLVFMLDAPPRTPLDRTTCVDCFSGTAAWVPAGDGAACWPPRVFHSIAEAVDGAPPGRVGVIVECVAPMLLCGGTMSDVVRGLQHLRCTDATVPPSAAGVRRASFLGVHAHEGLLSASALVALRSIASTTVSVSMVPPAGAGPSVMRAVANLTELNTRTRKVHASVQHLVIHSDGKLELCEDPDAGLEDVAAITDAPPEGSAALLGGLAYSSKPTVAALPGKALIYMEADDGDSDSDDELDDDLDI